MIFGGRPSWICLGRIWTTHDGYLVVFIAVQNLVVTDAADEYLVRLA